MARTRTTERRPRTAKRRRPAAERGQGIVEFAIIFPIFIMLVFVMVDGGILMGRYNQVNHAAQEGARFGATGASASAIAARARAQSNDLLGTVPTSCANQSERICVQWFEGPNDEPAGEVGSSVRVTIRYDHNLITPLDAAAFGMGGLPGHFDVDSCAIARLERPASVSASSGTASC
jgi:Flp pilus assembly protein TadG